MAIGASVTVSIAAETMGISSSRSLVRRVLVETSVGRTSLLAGISRTSSKVSPSLRNFPSCSTRKVYVPETITSAACTAGAGATGAQGVMRVSCYSLDT